MQKCRNGRLRGAGLHVRIRLAAAFSNFSRQLSIDAMESQSTVIRALNLEPPNVKKMAQKYSISGPGLTGRPLGASEAANPESLALQ